MRTIDANGPQGNALFIMGFAKKIGRQLEAESIWEEGTTENLIKNMMSGDYEHLCTTFNEQFEGIAEVVNWE
jgi:hypothetical protein